MHTVWKLQDVIKFFPCNIWRLLRYIFVLNVNIFYIYVYPVPFFGLIALKCQLQRISTSMSFHSAFPLSLWLNEIALPKVIKMYFTTVCVIKFQKEIHTGFSLTPNLKPWFYALSPVYNFKVNDLETLKRSTDICVYIGIFLNRTINPLILDFMSW